MRDGTLVARRGRLILDNGAYSADAPFFPQLAAMHAVGPYRIPNVSVDASLAYTNTTPSGSVRAPTAPQACWAVEQHMDSVAAAIGMDPVELRRKNILKEGDTTATNQVLEPIGAAETLERAVELIGYGKDLPEDEAIGVGCGWWPSFGGPSGAYVKLNGDGSGTIITGAQECGTGAVMALPLLVAEELGMRPEDFSILAQDTDAGPWDAGASGSQTTFNNGRAVIEAAREVRAQLLELAEEELEASREDIELVDGVARVKGSPTKSVPITTLAETAQGDKLLLGKGSGSPPPTPDVDALRLHRPAGDGDVRRADVHHPRRPRQGRPRDRRVPRARGGRVARLRRHPEPGRSRGPGRGRRRDGHRDGDCSRARSSARTAGRGTRTCSTTSCRRRPTRRRSRSRSSTRPARTAGRRARRGPASRRACRLPARSATQSPR